MVPEYDTRTTRLRLNLPPSPRAVLARHGIAAPLPSADARAVLARYGLLPTWMAAADRSEPAREGAAPGEGTPVEPAPVPSRTRPAGMALPTPPPVAPLPAPRRRRGPLGWILDRVGMTADLYRQRVRRHLATGGGRSRRQGWGGVA